MTVQTRRVPFSGRRAYARALALVVAVAALLVASAAPAQATNHDYCNWDGSYLFGPTPWTLCATPVARNIWQNYAYLPFGETDTTVYCGAALNGVQYGSNTSGTLSCNHTYAGTNGLVAYLFVGPVSRTVHGSISY